MSSAPGQGTLFYFAQSEGVAEPVVAEKPKAKPKRNRWRAPESPKQLEVVSLPDHTATVVPLPDLPKTIGDCRGPGICPVLRCSANLLVSIVREGVSESIVVGGRGGTGKGASLTATQNGTRTKHGNLTRDTLDALTDEMADLVVARAEALPSTCMWDYIENGDLIEGRDELESDEDDRTNRAFAAHMTLEQVAEVFGVTRERIRQVEYKALMRAKVSDKAEELDPYFVPAKKLTRRARS